MWQYTPYTLSLSLVAVVWRCWPPAGRRRPASGAGPFALVMSSRHFLRRLCRGVGLRATGPKDGRDLRGIRWHRHGPRQLVGLLVLRYTGRDRGLTPRVLRWLAVEPALTLLLLLTNDWHHLYYTRAWPDSVGLYAALGLEHGAGFYLHTVYSYAFMAVGSVWLVRSLWRSAGVYRGQAVALFLGAFTPWLAGMTYVFHLSPWPRLDLTPFGLAGTGLAVGWAIRQAGFLDIVPVAREAIFENMADGMIALDSQGRVAYANPGAARHIMGLVDDGIGAPTGGCTEFGVGAGAARRDFDVRRLPLQDARGRSGGQLTALSDVTARKGAEKALRDGEARYRSIVETTAEGIWILAGDATVSFVNQRMADMLGYTVAEMIGS